MILSIFCNWHGITYGHRHERVTTLELEGYKLSGIITLNIGNLAFLRKITSETTASLLKIPMELGSLTKIFST
jgi:hypothetical protein